MKLASIGLGLFIYASNASAQVPLTARDMGDIYASCNRSCVTTQRNDPNNKSLMDRQFLIDAYCSCTCARISMQLTSIQVSEIVRTQDKFHALAHNPGVKNLQLSESKRCAEVVLQP